MHISMHRTLTIKIKVKPNKTLDSETPPLFIKVPVPSKKLSDHKFVLGVSMLSLTMICIWDFRAVPTV